jgi:ribulose-5-phosphate 4-epimerase/fuculose-1-phosphate aldolase
MKILLVGGNFADNIRPSGFVKKLYEEIQKLSPDYDIVYHNGGEFSELQESLNQEFFFDAILWFANVPNEYEKLVDDIKVRSPKSLLITSKNNLDNKYSYHDMTGRMLKVKANLCLVFTKTELVETTIIDPLMNAFTMKETEIKTVASVLMKRIEELSSYTRVSSESIGPALEVPNQEEFFSLANGYAEVYHELIHANNTTRYLGNLSFRCEKGFPSFKHHDTIFVSRRNVDKRDIGLQGFVGVNLRYTDKICYHGEVKPSVDTPIQVALYNHFPKINYMMHSHVYLVGGTFTKEKIPCGAMEEVDSILKLFPDPNYTMLKINLYGHGSIVMSNTIETFKDLKYCARPFPEFEQPKKRKK